MGRLFRSVGNSIVNRRRFIILIGLLLMIVSLLGAMRITMAAGYDTWVSSDSKTYKDYEKFGEHFGSDVILVMVTGESLEQLLNPENMKAVESIEDRMGDNPKVISAIGPTYLLKRAVAYMTGETSLPENKSLVQTIIRDGQSGEIRVEFKEVLPDERHVLIPIVLEGGMSRGEQKVLVQETERAVSSADFTGVEPIVTGSPTLTSKLEDLIADSMRNMFIVAIVLMFLILAFIFSVRGFFAWRWLPLGAVGIGIIYAFGSMGLLSLPITAVTMGVFPILIGLGVDYSIQLHSRYDEEGKTGKTPKDAVAGAVSHVGPAISIALITVCLGFAAMMFSPVPMIQDFGFDLIIGVIGCYIVAMFLPMLVLYWRDSRSVRKPRSEAIKVQAIGDRPIERKQGFVEEMLGRLAPRVIRNPKVIIPVAVILTVAGLFADPYVKTETDLSNIISEDVQVMRDYQALEEVAGGVATVSLMVECEEVFRPEVLSWMVEVENRICTEMIEDVRSTKSIADLVLLTNGGEIPRSSEVSKKILESVPKPIKRNLVSDDWCAANVIVGIREFDVDRMKELRARLNDCTTDCPAGLDVSVTGTTIIETALLEGMGGSRMKITLIGVGFVFLGLFFLFRFNLIKSLMAILPIALIVGWSGGLIYLSGIKYSPLTACLGALILGIGVEYTILLMMRYYEERGKGGEPEEAMTIAMKKIGRAIIASGVTTMGGFAALLAAGGFIIVRDFGIMTLINVFLALVSTLVVLPPLIVWVDGWRERRRLAKEPIEVHDIDMVDFADEELKDKVRSV